MDEPVSQQWLKSLVHLVKCTPLLCISVEILSSRQKKAEALKKLTDVAVRMSEEQLVELRADIKVGGLHEPLFDHEAYCVDWTVEADAMPEIKAGIPDSE